MIAYFLEDVPENFNIAAGELAIALTPLACYKLDKKHIEYKIPEDFYSQFDEDAFFFEQLEWFQIFVDFIDSIFPFRKKCGIGLAWLYYLPLKNIVDTVIKHSSILISICQTLKPKKAIFYHIHRDKEDYMLDRFWQFETYTVFARLLPILCNQKGIEYSIKKIQFSYNKIFGKKNPIYRIGKFLKRFLRVPNRISENLRDRDYFRRLPSSKKKATFLFLDTCWDLDYKAREAVVRGNRVLVQKGRAIRLFSQLGIPLQKIFTIPKYDSLDIRHRKGEEYRIPADILMWLKEKSGIDVTDVIEPKLRYFIDEICPKTIRYYHIYKRLIKQEKIDYVIISTMDTMESIAHLGASLASKQNDNVSLVRVQHGSGAIFDNYSSDLIRLGIADVFVTHSKELKEHYERRKKYYPVKMADIVVDAFHIRHIKNKYFSVNVGKKRKKKEEK